MRNSTLRRRTYTKERLPFLEDMQSQGSMPFENEIKEYERPSKQKELDALWRNFKVNQNIGGKSPGVYLIVGFITGALCMLSMSILMSIGSVSDFDFSSGSDKLVRRDSAKSNVAIVPSDNSVISHQNANSGNETYTVVSGDTLESIIIRFYGKFDPTKVEAIQKANNMANPNQLRLGQVLKIPL